MSLTYPLAESAREALEAASTARTVGEARELAGAVVSLVSEWLRPSEGEQQTLQEKIDAGVTAGFIQVYEDNQGRRVFGVAFWKRGAAPPAPPPRSEPVPEPSAEPPAAGDTVDDLYFERGRTTRRASRGRKTRAGDPNQMDLFAGPEHSRASLPEAGDPAAGAGAGAGLAPPEPAPPPPARGKPGPNRKRRATP